MAGLPEKEQAAEKREAGSPPMTVSAGQITLSHSALPSGKETGTVTSNGVLQMPGL